MNNRPSYLSQLAKALLFVCFSAFLISCETLSYYNQAAKGQLAILFSRESIVTLLSKDSLDPALREKLNLVLDIRSFAESELQLPVADNYGSYVDVGRKHVVWNVFAAPEFSTAPINWCYPIAGCVSYRGYFSEAAANAFALATAADGYDVYTGGVDAYSTLGWFEDSLLSTVINRSDFQLAALIFHELAHQVVYLPGDTTFNESFATTVEREGLRRWLIQRGDSAALADAELIRLRQSQFIELVKEYQQKFDKLYQQDLVAQEMRAGKRQLQDELRDAYAAIKLAWGGYDGYDSWFAKPLNNAQLSTVSAYNDLVPFFESELTDLHGDLGEFYQRVETLSQLGKSELDLIIEDFSDAGS